jgi:putative DNA methylase
VTRMIERWFPCAEVSEASRSGWGSGKSEKALFTWFAARPLAQAKAAVITSLLPWPEDVAEQRRLQDLVRRAMTDRDAGWSDLVRELGKEYPNGASLLDPFSGRAMIPLEASRLCVRAHGIDYSPVATLAGQLLADYPLRDWSDEPELPFPTDVTMDAGPGRLVPDVRAVLDEIGRRYDEAMSPFYPKVAGRQPWGYVWAVTLPCQECGRRFPLTGSLTLRYPLVGKGDPGQSYRIEVDLQANTFQAIVHSGLPVTPPTLITVQRGSKMARGKSAVCPFCGHVHSKDVHTRLAAGGLGRDALLVAADLDDNVGKAFRLPSHQEAEAASSAATALTAELPFRPGVLAIPNEEIPPGDFDTVRPSAYGAKTYGDLANARQTLGFVRLSRIISNLGTELVHDHGLSADYAAALVGYAGSVLVRKIKYSTRGSALRAHQHATSNRVQTNHIFSNEASISFSYDYFETGLGDGPGTWPSLAGDTLAVLRAQAGRPGGRQARIARGSATALPVRESSVDAVVTDPPYDSMIDYSDASDLFYVWLKRALGTTHAWFAMTADKRGLQEKDEEIIVKRGGSGVGDHRNERFYDTMISKAFEQARRVVSDDGVVTIVFGHGDPEVWHRLLGAISSAGLVLTGSWPAKTESGGSAGSANIVTTLTIATRPASADRPERLAAVVEAEVAAEVKKRLPIWEQAGLAPTDMLMASAGPAMEVVGRYSRVLDIKGAPVEADRYLLSARRAVQEAAAIEVDHLPLETFDVRTRFALWWIRLYGRQLAPKSELRWQALAANLGLKEVRDLVVDADKGCRFVGSKHFATPIEEGSSAVDVALGMAAAWGEGLDAVGDVLNRAARDGDDSYLWATVRFLADRLPESDPDAVIWNRLIQNRKSVRAASEGSAKTRQLAETASSAREAQRSLFESEEST